MNEALTDVGFEVAEGEMLFVTGHSGAGKSTLLRLIQLTERPSRLYGESGSHYQNQGLKLSKHFKAW